MYSCWRTRIKRVRYVGAETDSFNGGGGGDATYCESGVAFFFLYDLL